MFKMCLFQLSSVIILVATSVGYTEEILFGSGESSTEFSNRYSRPNDDTFQNNASGSAYESNSQQIVLKVDKLSNNGLKLSFVWEAASTTGRHVEDGLNFDLVEILNPLKDKENWSRTPIKIDYPPNVDEDSSRDDKKGSVLRAEVELGSFSLNQDGKYVGKLNVVFVGQRSALTAQLSAQKQPKGGIYQFIDWEIEVRQGKANLVKFSLRRFNSKVPLRLIGSNYLPSSQFLKSYPMQKPIALCKKEKVGKGANQAIERPTFSEVLTLRVAKAIKQSGCVACHGEGTKDNFRMCDDGRPVFKEDYQAILGLVKNFDNIDWSLYPRRMKRAVERLRGFNEKTELVTAWALNGGASKIQPPKVATTSPPKDSTNTEKPSGDTKVARVINPLGDQDEKRRIFLGREYFVSIDRGKVRTKGNNEDGQLGREQNFGEYSSKPADAARVEPFDVVTAHTMSIVENTNCVVAGRDRQVYCWGNDDFGTLGQMKERLFKKISWVNWPERRDEFVPQLVSGTENTARIYSTGEIFGESIVCAAHSTGGLKCWGSNPTLKREQKVLSPPLSIKGLDKVAVVDMVWGARHACVLSDKGNVYCFGNNYPFMSLGQPSHLQESEHAVQVPELEKVVQIASTQEATCALQNNGKVKCWGWHDFKGKYDRIHAIEFPFKELANQIVAGKQHLCAKSLNGQVSCWGWNYYGVLGMGFVNWDTYHVPKKIVAFPQNVQVKRLYLNQFGTVTCAISEADSVYCWGRDLYGLTGTVHSNSGTPVPKPVKGLEKNVTSLSLGQHGGACAFRSDRAEPLCWGRILVDNNQPETVTVPIPITGLF